jgi:O-methyltransferase involved in polyketide biosynthesis
LEAKINIHETAFVTASFRAGENALSKDNYAHLWANEITDQHARRYLNAVSLHEGMAHCLRNRYFLESLQAHIEKGDIDTLVNFGCGFSMYPFLLDPSLLFVEIDTPDVITHKQRRLDHWQEEKILPPRDILFLSANFNDHSLEYLHGALDPLIRGRKCFFLLEGVLFFLGRQDTLNLFELFRRLQQPGDLVGSVSFTPALEKQVVFRKLIDFVEGNLEKNQQFHYQTLADDFYRTLNAYTLFDHQNTLSLAKRYLPGLSLPEEEVLNEQMYLLRKQ